MDEKIQKVIAKVRELERAKAEVSRIEGEIGALVVGGVIPVAATAAQRVEVTKADAPISLPWRLENLLRDNPGKTFTPKDAAEALGEEPRKTHASLLHRLARRGKIAKVAPGVFRAKLRRGRPSKVRS